MKKIYYSTITLTAILLLFLIPSSNNNTTEQFEYDVIFLYGERVYDPTAEHHRNKIETICEANDLSFKYLSGQSLGSYSNYRADMLILFAHGYFTHTEIHRQNYPNVEIEAFIAGMNISYLVSQSCFGYRWHNLPEKIDILSSSNDTEAIFRVKTSGEPVWDFMDSFLDHFSFDFGTAFNLTASDLSVEGYLYDEDADMTIWSRTAGEYSYINFENTSSGIVVPSDY